MIDFQITKLNLARHCLITLIKVYSIKELHLPYYICPALWRNIKRFNPQCRLKFYHINDNFLPLKEFEKDDFILYPDYFGINRKNVQVLTAKYSNLIIDNAQAFFAPPAGLASFYSLRKFFPVQCGAYLYTRKTFTHNYPKDNNIYKNKFHPTYKEFVQNELVLNNQPPFLMSESIKISGSNERERRIENFYRLHEKYKNINQLNIELTENDVPFVYPCLTEESDKLALQLEKEGKTILRYWNNIPQSFPEYKFYRNLVPVPL